MAYIAEGGKCLFKFLHDRAANEAGCEQSSTKHASELFLEF
jgi:hypothetical protein